MYRKRNLCLGYVSEKSDMVEAVARRCSVKKVFLEISRNSLENTCARVSLFLLNFQEYFFYKKPPVAASNMGLQCP